MMKHGLIDGQKREVLLPQHQGGANFFISMSRESFIQDVISGEFIKMLQISPKERNNSQLKSNLNMRRRDSSHNYDPRRGRFMMKKKKIVS